MRWSQQDLECFWKSDQRNPLITGFWTCKAWHVWRVKTGLYRRFAHGTNIPPTTYCVGQGKFPFLLPSSAFLQLTSLLRPYLQQAQEWELPHGLSWSQAVMRPPA